MRDAGLPYPKSGCYHCMNGGLMGCPYEKPQAVEVVVETPSPQPGQPWVHRNGKKYTVLHLTNLDSDRDDYKPQVVYQGANGKIWSRALSDWHRSFTPDIVGERVNATLVQLRDGLYQHHAEQLTFTRLDKRVDAAIKGIEGDYIATGDLVGLLRDLRDALLIETTSKGPPIRDWRAANPT